MSHNTNPLLHSRNTAKAIASVCSLYILYCFLLRVYFFSSSIMLSFGIYLFSQPRKISCSCYTCLKKSEYITQSAVNCKPLNVCMSFCVDGRQCSFLSAFFLDEEVMFEILMIIFFKKNLIYYSLLKPRMVKLSRENKSHCSNDSRP